MLTAHFHDASGKFVRMQNDAQGAIDEVLMAGKRAADEACRIIPGMPRGANVTGAGSVQESAATAANICHRPVRAPMSLMGPSSPYTSPYVSPYVSPYGGSLGQYGRNGRTALGDFWDDASNLASKIINGAQGAASDVCKIAPAAQIVAGAAGSGSVQSAAERINSICGNQPVGGSASGGNVLPTKPKYPTSCLTRYNTTRRTWAVYCPPGVHANQGLGMFGNLGADVPTSPPAPAGIPKVADEVVQPTGATVMSPSEEKDMPWYKNWKFWTAVGGGVAVVGTGSYFLFRRKH